MGNYNARSGFSDQITSPEGIFILIVCGLVGVAVFAIYARKDGESLGWGGAFMGFSAGSTFLGLLVGIVLSLF